MLQELERQLAEWKNKCEMIEKRDTERRALDEKKHAEEARLNICSLSCAIYLS